MDENKFLSEIEVRGDLTRDQAYKVAVAVLQELHDRLSSKEADHLAAQLPGALKRMWHSLDAPWRDVRRTHERDFIRHIADTVEIDEAKAHKSLMAAFKALQMLLGSPSGQEGVAWDVFSQLPKDLKRIWLTSAGMAKPKAVKPRLGLSARA
ncbi:MAG TPA: DUF2267 domain-containing protein [Candidatus Binataceae bacterium]|nr:DUF2267 domain-containing protein [Candidatus Binataceae bacterium]